MLHLIYRLAAVMIATATVSFLGGCAVTRIDVDVYKGPMANHPDVQTEQLAALAMGAKPLLIELRDKLDRIKVGRDGAITVGESESTPGHAGNVKYGDGGFIPAPDRAGSGPYGSHVEWLLNRQAIQVNGILSLYDDVNHNGIVDLVMAAKESLGRYQAAWAIYTDQNNHDSEIWDGLELDSAVAQDVKQNPDLKSNAALVEKYKGLLIARNGIRIQWTLFPDQDRDANHQFRVLAEDLNGKVTADANTLFGSQDGNRSQDKKKFIARVKYVSKAFLDARQAIHDLFRVSLRIVIQVNSPDYTGVDSKNITAACANFCTQVIERTALYFEICYPKGAGSSDLGEKLQPLLGNGFFNPADIDNDPQKNDPQKGDHFAAFAKKKRQMDGALYNLLISDPVSAASDLLNIDLAVARETAPEGFPDANRFGLARIRPVEKSGSGASTVPPDSKPPVVPPALPNDPAMGAATGPAIAPALSGGAQTSPNQGIPLTHDTPNDINKFVITNKFSKVYGETAHATELFGEETLVKLVGGGSFGSGTGLEGGRLDDGLTTTITNYRRAASWFDRSPRSQEAKDSIDSARRSLVRELIHFAEKLTFIADNQLLLEKNNETDFDNDKDYQRSAAVLQEIGNSILVAANELYERSDYQANRDGPTAKERVAGQLAQIKSMLAGSALQDLLQMYVSDPTPLIDPKVVKERDAAKTTLTAKQAALITASAATQPARSVVDQDNGDLQLIGDSSRTFDPMADATLGPILKSAANTIKPADLAKAITDAASKHYFEAIGTDGAAKAKALFDQVSRTPLPATPLPDTASGRATAAITVSDAIRNLPKNDQSALDTVVQASKDAQSAVDDASKTVKEKDDAYSKELSGTSAALQILVEQAKAVPVDESFRTTMSQKLAELLTATPVGPKHDTVQQSIDLFPKITVPNPLATVATKDNQTPRDVMDDLLVSLRLQHVNSVQQLGENSPRAQELAAAIHLAEMYRSDMVYIRPPAAYLRTSNVATILQQGGADTAWHNLLAHQAARSVPLAGEALDHIMNGTPDYEAIHHIDQQFWQNINTVRVAGSGITNYVITKDDIGNWYVKNYAGDPKPIIDAAKSVALYNAGSAIGGASAASRAMQLNQDPKSTPQTLADVQMATFTDDYNKSTTAFAAELAGDGDKKPAAQQTLDTALDSAWDSDSSLKDVVSQVKDGVKKSAETSADIAKDAGINSTSDAKKDPDLPTKILKALQGLKAYQDRLLAGVDNLHLDNSAAIKADRTTLAQKQADQKAKSASGSVTATDLAAADKAVADAQDQLNTDVTAAQQQVANAKTDIITTFTGVVNPMIQKRLDTVTTYSTALNVLQRARTVTPATKPATTNQEASVSP